MKGQTSVWEERYTNHIPYKTFYTICKELLHLNDRKNKHSLKRGVVVEALKEYCTMIIQK